MKHSYRQAIWRYDYRKSKGGLETRQSFNSIWPISAADNGLSCITIQAIVSEKHYCKILKGTRLLHKTFFRNEFFELQKCEKPIMCRHKWLLWTLSPQHIRGSIGRINSFVFQLHVFIKKMGRVLGLRLGRSLAVRATHWRISIKNGEKNLAETDKGSWYEQSSLHILEKPSTSSASSGLVGIELDGAAETFLCLEFLFLAGILNWMKLCFTQLQDSFKRRELWEQK